MIEGILLFLAISIAIELIFLACIPETQFFIQNREPLTREMWYYFSSVGEVYAAQKSPAGRFLLGA